MEADKESIVTQKRDRRVRNQSCAYRKTPLLPKMRMVTKNKKNKQFETVKIHVLSFLSMSIVQT